jgi:hypothetical protein
LGFSTAGRLGFAGVPRERGSGHWGDPLATMLGAKGSVGWEWCSPRHELNRDGLLGRDGGARRGGRCGARGRVDSAMPQAPWHIGDAPGVEVTLLRGSGRAGVTERRSAAEQGSRATEQGGCGAEHRWRRRGLGLGAGGLELLLVERRDHLGVRAREEEIAGDLGGAVAPEKKGEEGVEGADARARVIRQRGKGPALRKSWAGDALSSGVGRKVGRLGPCGERGRGERGPEREKREKRKAGPLGESRPKRVGCLPFLFFFFSFPTPNYSNNLFEFK